MSDTESSGSTFLDKLRWFAELDPDRLVFTYSEAGEPNGEDLSYGQLYREAQSISVQIARSLRPRSRALLLYPPGLDFIKAFFGCLYAGVIAVPAYPPIPQRLKRTLPRLKAIVDDAGVSAVLTTSSLLQAKLAFAEHAPLFARLRWLATDAVDESADPHEQLRIDSSDCALLQYTSGSTASPKGVVITHRNLMANAKLIQGCFQADGSAVGVSWLPPYHDMGLIGGILEPIYLGAYTVWMSPLSFIQRPLRWLQAMSRLRASIAGAPNFAYELCAERITDSEKKSLDLSNWRVAFCGAEPVRKETLARFHEAFRSCGFREEAFYPCYGLAESTLAASGGSAAKCPVSLRVKKDEFDRGTLDPAGAEDTRSVNLVGCGSERPEHEIRVVDPLSCKLVRDGEIGEIWLRGPSVASGYWNSLDDSERTFGARIADSNDGPYLRTGDLGALRDGELYVTGRIKDLLIVRGRNLFATDIERTVERTSTLFQAGATAAFSIPGDREERVVVLQAYRPGGDDDADLRVQLLETAVENVTQEHDARPHQILLVSPRSIFKTPSGKVQRFACRDAYLSGTLDVLAQWPENV